MISKSAQRILDALLDQQLAGTMVVIDKHVFPRGVCAKDMAFHCYHSGILFYWSIENYYFRKVTP